MRQPEESTDVAHSIEDRGWMEEALTLARRSVGLASPNPNVGCVLVRDGRLVGSGFHEYDKLDHAEIVALKEGGEAARGAVAYVTLEPCSHHGRTGPCVDALIAAGVSRVVVATADPNPAVNGKGIERLQAAGIAVTKGVLTAPAQRLNDAFAKFIRTGNPFVTMKIAATLDGRIAPPPAERIRGEIVWITGPASREHVHTLRHEADAVITGIGTVLEDDPQLTDRSGKPRRRPLLRVVLDSALRLPLDSKLVRSAQDDLLVFYSSASDERILMFESSGVRLERLSVHSQVNGLPLRPVLERLAELGIVHLMVEGGGQINASMLKEELVDRMFLFYAPHFLGANAAPAFGSLASSRSKLREYALHRFGNDFALEGWVGDPWATVV